MSVESHVESAAVDESTRRVYRLLSDGIESIGGIEIAAGICGADRSDLRKALDRNSRHIWVEHAIAIGARVRRFNATLATKLGSALVETFELDVFPRVQLSQDEENRRLKALVRSLPLGEQLLADTLGGRR